MQIKQLVFYQLIKKNMLDWTSTRDYVPKPNKTFQQ
jgi:hypothetical protein